MTEATLYERRRIFHRCGRRPFQRRGREKPHRWPEIREPGSPGVAHQESGPRRDVPRPRPRVDPFVRPIAARLIGNYAVNSAAIRCTVEVPTPSSLASLRIPGRFFCRSALRMASSIAFSTLGRPSRFPSALATSKACANTLLDHRAFKLCDPFFVPYPRHSAPIA
jgi:hypothetical protein